MKRSVLLLLSGLLGTAYIVYLVVFFSNGLINSESDMEFLSGGIAAALVAPHMVCVGLAVIFNWMGWALKVRWGALVAGILYAVSIIFMIIYGFFVIVQMILCFVAFARMKNNDI